MSQHGFRSPQFRCSAKDPPRSREHTSTDRSGRTPHVTSPPGWLPDPTGRFEKRYFDGEAWTNQVLDREEIPATDVYKQPVTSHGEPAETKERVGELRSPSHEAPRAAPTSSASVLACGLILACGVAVLLSVLSMPWFDASATSTVAVKLSDFRASGIGQAVLASAPVAESYADLGISQSYAEVGYIVALLSTAFAALAIFLSKPVRVLAGLTAAACAVWHVLALDDLTRNVHAAAGAYVGAVGLVGVIVVLVFASKGDNNDQVVARLKHSATDG